MITNKEWTYDNPKDLLKALLEWSKANVETDWNVDECHIKAEFQEYVDVIEEHLKENK
tara:strand:+ start:290 stop:463 length:174 start_codon:yes stop_codon:yes gene_type:complete